MILSWNQGTLLLIFTLLPYLMIMIYFSKLLETISLIDLIPELQQIDLADIVCYPGGGGVLPYITYTGMCRPKGSWFWSSWFRTGYPFQRRFLERGIIFRMHESSTFVSGHLKVFKDRLLLKIRFNALTSKPLYSCCTLERSIKKLAHS